MSNVSIGAIALPNWYVSNAGADRNFTVTATNSSPNISSAALFPPQAVGTGGYTISLGGAEYTVAYVTSTSAAVLTSNYAGATGPTACVWYKWIFAQIYSNQAFQPFGASYVVNQGVPGEGPVYKKYACSLVTSVGITYLKHPAITIDSTTDSPSGNFARYYFGLFRIDGSFVDILPGLGEAQVPPTTPTSLADLVIYNRLPIQPSGAWPDFYSADEIDSRFPPLTAGQSYYAAVTGTTMRPLTFGAGLSIDLVLGILSASGGNFPPRTVPPTSTILAATDGAIFLDCSAGPVTFNLTAAASVSGKIFFVQKIDATANAGTLDPNGAETINGASTFTLSRQWSAALIYSDGAAWHVFAGLNLSGTGSVRTVTANTTLLSTDGLILCDCTAGIITVSIPPLATLTGLGPFTIKKIDLGVNPVLVDPNGTETIDSLFSVMLFAQQSVTFQSDGVSLRIIQ